MTGGSFLDWNFVSAIGPRTWPRDGLLQAVSMSTGSTNPSNCSFALATASVKCDCMLDLGLIFYPFLADF